MISDFKEIKVTGVMMNYYHICHRELWYFAHDLQMEHESDTVLIGKLIHEDSYDGDQKEIIFNDLIKLDRISSDGIVHEIKKSNKVENAHVWQLKYYLWILKQNGIDNIKGKIDYPKLRKTVTIELEEHDNEIIREKIKAIQELIRTNSPPLVNRKKICRNCSYFELCWS